MSINTKELKIKEGLIDFSNYKITFFSYILSTVLRKSFESKQGILIAVPK